VPWAWLDIGLLDRRDEARHIAGPTQKGSGLDGGRAEQGEPEDCGNRGTSGDAPS
jgi:hypothetical protein